jgi:hypothetical protein
VLLCFGATKTFTKYKITTANAKLIAASYILYRYVDNRTMAMQIMGLGYSRPSTICGVQYSIYCRITHHGAMY